MTPPPWWRALYVVAVPLLAAGLAVGVAAATVGMTGSGTGQAITGSVTLSVNVPASHTCDLTGPPAGIGTACTFSVSYTGTLGAYLSLTVLVTSAAGVGGKPLYDGTNNSGLTLAISDGHTSYRVPTGPGQTGCGAGLTCWTSANELAAWYQGGSAELEFTTGDSVTFTVTPDFAGAAGAAYQGGTASVRLTVQAVQAPANPLPPSCTTNTVGQPCPPADTFTWS